MASQVILPDDEEGTSPSRPLSPFCSHFSVWFLLPSSCVAPVMALLCLSSTGMAARSMGIDRAPQMHMGAINWKIPEMLSWHPKPNMCQTKPILYPMNLQFILCSWCSCLYLTREAGCVGPSPSLIQLAEKSTVQEHFGSTSRTF